MFYDRFNKIRLPAIIESLYPPVFTRNRNGEKIIDIATCDQVGFEKHGIVIPEDITLEMIRECWINPYHIDRKSQIETYQVKSSDGKKDHTVKLENGRYTCDCKGFMFRGNCARY